MDHVARFKALISEIKLGGRYRTLSNSSGSPARFRPSPIRLMGSGIGSIPFKSFVHAIDGLLQATVPGHFEIAAKAVPLSEVEQAWSSHSST
jgi:hypothetical protein